MINLCFCSLFLNTKRIRQEADSSQLLDIPGNMVLGLGQQVLTLSGLNGRPGQVVLHLVPLHRQELEVLVRYAQLVHRLGLKRGEKTRALSNFP